MYTQFGGIFLFISLKLRLGQPASYSDNSEWFKGFLHGVNIYSFALDKLDVLNMSQNCQIHMVSMSLFHAFQLVVPYTILFLGECITPSYVRVAVIGHCVNSGPS